VTRQIDLGKRNAEIVALLKARQMPMREIARRYSLSPQSISLIAIRHGNYAKALDPNKVRAASKLIKRGMPLTHVAQTVGLDYRRLRHLTANPDVRCTPSPG
jgi:lambda repressor-like predicted transcriptional regulator